jgi:ribonuclease Z
MATDNITFLGTSDAIPSWERSHASLVAHMAHKTILLDCGEPCAKNLAFECVNFGSIDAILLSHLHPDHVAGLLQVIIGMWLEAKRTRDIIVYMPAEGVETFRKLILTTYLFPELIKFNVDFRPLSDGQTFEIGPVQVTPHRTTHLDSIRRVAGDKHGIACEPFLYELAASGKRVVYSGDMGEPADLLSVLDRPLDLLVTECAHFSPQTLFETLRGKPVQRVALTHLHRQLWEKKEELPAMAKEYGLADKLVIARDGMKVEF